MTTVDIDMKKFSLTPYGRYKEDGPKSGERFRSEFLVDAFRNPDVDKVIVRLDSVSPGYEYSSSFLEEVFGGLIRVEGISSDVLLKKLEVVTDYADYRVEIDNYIKRAAND